MNEPIVSVEEVQRRAREAFEQRQPISANPFPWHSAAHQTWRDEYVRLQEGQ